MSQSELLKTVVRVLDEAGIEYMVTGSIASSLQGEPRSTHDVDLVVALKPSGVDALIRAFPAPNFYLSAESIDDALRHQSMFNLLDVNQGDKVDFWILTNEPFDQSRFQRRQRQAFEGISINMSSAEDTILAKLRWAQLSGGSEKQFRDALRVYEVQYKVLDLGYLRTWAARIAVESLFQRLQDEAETL